MPKQLLDPIKLIKPGRLLKPRVLKAPCRLPEPLGIPNILEFKSLASELRSLMPMRDGNGTLQFRVLRRGEKPLNRFARRLIAQRLVTGQYK